MRTLVAAATLVLSLSAAAACGGDDDEAGGEGSQAARAIQPEAQELAESLLPTLSDFPDGWRAEPNAEAEEEGEDDFRKCVGADFSAFTIVGEATSDDFAMGETAARVSSTADVLETEQMAVDALAAQAAALEGEAADDCMTELIPSPEDESLEFGQVEVSPLSLTAPSGIDEAKAWQVVVPVEGVSGTESEGVTASVYVDLVHFREGATIATVETVDIVTPFDPELRDELVEAIAGRMTQ